MANFAPSFSKQFQNTCQKLTVTDTSPYGFSNNNEHYERTDFLIRQIILRDITGNTLQTKDITVGDSVEFDLTLLSFNQVSLSIGMVLAGAGVTGYDLRISSLLPCILP